MYAIVAHHPISCVGRVLQIWLFVWNLNVVLGEKWNSVDHKGLMYSVRSSLIPYYTIKGGYETCNQQWMYLIAAQQPILCGLCWQQDNENLIFYMTFGGFDDTVWTMMGLCLLLDAAPTILIHLRKAKNNSISNGCLLLQHIIPCSVFRGCPKSDMLHEIWKLFWGINDTVWTIRGLYMLLEAHPIILIHLRKTM